MAEATGQGIAIIGMAGRFPGAETLDRYWSNLRQGVEAIRVPGPEELARSVAAERLRHPDFVAAESRLEGVELFDAGFFDLNPREAELTDPQHRLMLECAWEALEAAGYPPQRFAGSTGVFAGCGINHYLLFNLLSNPELVAGVSPLQLTVASDKDYLSTRISYKLDLKGPSVGVQTACSTSLVAVHLACQSLLDFQCDLALAGGASVKPPGRPGYLHEPGGVLSRDGHCRPFDADASGTVFGSGLGLVVLKRLDEALTDGDTVLAVIRGSAVNNDGAVRAGFTAPGLAGQVAVVSEALAVAEVDAGSIDYVEAHGTGTALGDPIEVAALTRAFRASTAERGFCGLGSVKSGIGHLDAAAGIAGLVKTVLALRHRELPPSLHYATPNPRIDFASSPFYVSSELREWPSRGGPRRAGVSSFGIGGTNAHVVVEEAPPAPETAPAGRGHQLLVLSAKSEAALAAAAERLARHLAADPPASLADVAWTLQVGRTPLRHRRAVVCPGDAAAAAAALEAADAGETAVGESDGEERPVVFLFPGQGAQHPGMAAGLHAGEPVFRDAFDRCAELLAPHLEVDLRRVVLAADTGDAAAAERLAETWLTQPALFAVEYALARQWLAWGVRPRAMLGHSIGEYVAACLAGTLSLEDALALVAARGRLMHRLPEGAMLAVPRAAAEVEPMLGERLSLAADNAPTLCVVAGPPEAVEELARDLAGRGVAARRLRTSRAFHSAMMDPILAPFLEELDRVRLRPPELPWVSNVTGTWIRPEEATDPEYWVRHLRRPVRFTAAVGTLAGLAGAALVEVGPGRTLGVLCRRHPDVAAERPVVFSMPGGRRAEQEVPALLHALGRLWTTGVEPDWKAFHLGLPRRRVPLPTYAFERRPYWIERSPAGPAAAPAGDRRRALAEWFQVPSWKRLAPAEAPAVREGRRWLLFVRAEGVGAAVAAALEARGDQVVRVRPGPGFARLAAAEYALQPRRAEDFEALMRELAAEGGRPSRVVHLWTADPAGDDPAGAASGDAASDAESLEALGFASLFLLAQALGRSGEAGEVELTVVTRGIAQVDPHDDLAPAAALVLGPARVAAQELPGLTCRTVDVSAAPGEAAAVAGRLLAELDAPAEAELVALRGPRRLLRRYETVELPAAGRSPLRHHGVYLVTGGLGGVGLLVAGHLARQAAARLVLIGRSPFPPREEWEGRRGEQGPLGERVRALLDLEAAGAEVMVASADVTDEASLAAALAAGRRRFGPFHGLFHAAGAAGGGLLLRQTVEGMQPVLGPKVRGTLLLDALLAEDPLELLVLFASTFGITGGVGRVDYVAANAFLDAFAHQRAARGGPLTLALDWYGWEGVGMALRAPRPAPASPAAGVHGARADGAGAVGPLVHPLLGSPIRGASEDDEFVVRLSPQRHWVLAEHRLHGRPVVPGTALLEIARAALTGGLADARVELRETAFLAPLAVEDGGEREVRTVIGGGGDGGERTFRILGRRDGEDGWQVHATGRGAPLAGPPPAAVDLEAIRGRCSPLAAGETAAAGDRIATWGPRWQVLREAWSGAAEGLVRLELAPEHAGDLASLPLHPALLDVATASGLALAGHAGHLPFSYGRLRYHAPLSRRLWAHVRWPQAGGADERAVFDVTLCDDAGRVLAEVERFIARPAAAARSPQAAAPAAAEPATRPSGRAIRPAEGLEALDRALASGLGPQIAITPVDLAVLRGEQERGRRTLERQAVKAPAGERPRHPRPNLGVPFAAPESELDRLVAGLWEELLGLDRVGMDDNFFELGGHSLLAVELASRLRGELQVDVPLDRVFQEATVRALVRLVVEVITQAADESDLSRALTELEALGGVDPAAADAPITEVGNV